MMRVLLAAFAAFARYCLFLTCATAFLWTGLLVYGLSGNGIAAACVGGVVLVVQGSIYLAITDLAAERRHKAERERVLNDLKAARERGLR